MAGKTAVTSDSNDEAGTGGLADKNGTVQSATASLDTTNKRLQMTIPALGRYNTNSKLYAAFSAIASLIGLTAAKLLSGNTILGIAGTATSDATISVATQLRKGIIAYGKNGAKYTGTMTELAAKTWTPGTSNQEISANQFLAGVQTILGDSNLISDNIVYGKSLFGIAGTYQGYKNTGALPIVTNASGTPNFHGYSYSLSGSVRLTGGYVQFQGTGTLTITLDAATVAKIFAAYTKIKLSYDLCRDISGSISVTLQPKATVSWSNSASGSYTKEVSLTNTYELIIKNTTSYEVNLFTVSFV